MNQTDKLELAEKHLSIALSALEKIYNPIPWLQKEVENEGCNLNGVMALEYSSNAANLQAIAGHALDRIRNK